MRESHTTLYFSQLNSTPKLITAASVQVMIAVVANNLTMRYIVIMRIISNSALRTFAAKHPSAASPLQGWRRVIEKNRFKNLAEIKAIFNSVDKMGELAVFDIGGNKYRLIAYIRFEKQIIYVKAVLTHREYDKGAWKT